MELRYTSNNRIHSYNTYDYYEFYKTGLPRIRRKKYIVFEETYLYFLGKYLIEIKNEPSGIKIKKYRL